MNKQPLLKNGTKYKINVTWKVTIQTRKFASIAGVVFVAVGNSPAPVEIGLSVIARSLKAMNFPGLKVVTYNSYLVSIVSITNLPKKENNKDDMPRLITLKK